MMDYLRTNHDFWDGIAKTWSVHNKNPVVGWYDYHNQWPDYETVLFDGIKTHQKVALEYGCGPGRNIIKFADPAKWGFRRIDGVDISETNINNAWLNFRDVGLDFASKGMDTSILWKNNGSTLPMIFDETYDIVFSVIALQHIQSHSTRRSIFHEIARVLKPRGVFTAQMGFGPGHPRSVPYFNDATPHIDGDVRVESAADLENDLAAAGLHFFKYVLREPCKDEHPQWIWFQCLKSN